MSGSIQADPLTTRVTKIANRWHCQLVCDFLVVDEMACDNRLDLGWCFSEMLRWYDKLGNSPYSKMADSSRARQLKKGRKSKPIGRVWYQPELY